MNVSTHTTRRLVSLTGLAAVVAALAVPTALAHPATEGGDDTSRTRGGARPSLTRHARRDESGAGQRRPGNRNGNGRAPAPRGGRRPPVTRRARSDDSGAGRRPGNRNGNGAHLRLSVAGDLRSPDTRDVTFNPIAQDSPVAAPAPSDGTNWGVIGAMLAAIGLLIAGVGALGISGHGKRHGTVKPALAHEVARGRGTGRGAPAKGPLGLSVRRVLAGK